MTDTKKIHVEPTSTMAKGEDGSIQITFTLPWALVESSKTQALEEIAKEIEIPGFRKGMAPPDKVKSHVSEAKVTEKALGNILPETLGKALRQYKLVPAIYPKFELLSAKEGEDWQIRAVTCELPEIKLGDYKARIQTEGRAKNIWTPDKGSDKPKEPSKEEKEQAVLKILLEQTKIEIPKVLIDEEVNNRLSALLERTEKLGLSLDNYLASIGKNPETLRGEYEIQARNTISLELILNKVASEEDVKIKDGQIDEVISASSPNPEAREKINTPEQRRIISSYLARRAALDSLTSLL